MELSDDRKRWCRRINFYQGYKDMADKSTNALKH